MKFPIRILCITTLLWLCSNVSHAQVPKLNSHPSASAVIFLDFDGHIVNGTSWNYNGPFVCGASGLTDSQVNEIFNRVAEDYRPFNINITTDSTKYQAAPFNKRMRIVLTVSSSWYGSAGGVAFVGSFTWGDDSPGFVFTALLNYNTKYIAEAASHEAGHTLGMYHQSAYDAVCNKTSDYSSGVGSGEIGWAPIMGVGYYRNFTLWNNGPNSYGCTNYQNDLEIITASANGFGYRTDDHNNTFAAATLAPFTNNQFIVNGIVERNTDQDLIRFSIPERGNFKLEAVPYNVGTGNAGSNLDMQVTLLNEAQQTLNVYNPGTLLSSLVDTTLDPGAYFLRVEGKGNLYAPSYASLGSYSLQGSYGSTTVLPLHRLELKGSLNGDLHQLNWLVEADEAIINQTIEVSTDGRNFKTLTTATVDSRSYYYKPQSQNPVQYRVLVEFDNGRKHYSNIISIRGTADSQKPHLISTTIQSGHVKVSSPGKFEYAIIDFNGRVISKGNLTAGINTVEMNSSLVSGMYIIRFAGNSQQWTEKMIKP